MMSWNISVTGVSRDDLEEKLREAAEAYWPNLNPNAIEEAQEQFETALAAALAVAEMVQNGAPELPLNVAVSGHANPSHGLAQGYARESTMVTVSGQV
jgi:hypothetical protein